MQGCSQPVCGRSIGANCIESTFSDKNSTTACSNRDLSALIIRLLSAKPSRYLNSVLEHACNYLIMCLLIFPASLTSGHPQPAAEQEEFSTELPAMRTQLQLHGYTSM